MASKSMVFRFGDVEAHEREFLLLKSGETLPVEPKAFRVLLILLRNPGKLISKEDLLNSVWGDAAVTENSLARSIALLRKLLGDDPRNPRYIETVATVGYRFVSKVEVSEDASASLEGDADGVELVSAYPNEVESGKRTHVTETRLPRWLALCGVVLTVGLALVLYLSRPLPPPRITKFTQITHDGRSKNLGGTDGSRVYFTQISPRAIAEVGSDGGGITQIPIALPNQEPFLFDISPDGNTALIGTGGDGQLNHTLWSARILGGAFRRLGEVQDAEYAPDGSILSTNLEGDIDRMQSDGTGQGKLASPGRGTIDPHLSPDGKVIRFQKVQGNETLFEMLPDGKEIHSLLGDWKVDGAQWNGRWTPDGRFYLFLVGHPSFEPSQIWALDERRRLFPRSKQPIQLTSGPIRWVGLVPSKDGKTIFAEGQTHRGELSRFDAHAKEFRPFLGGISAEFAVFSKDGNSVAYVTFPEGILWKANRDGTHPVQLTEPPLYPSNPHWSPDCTQILFSDGKNARIYTVPSSGGSSPRRLLSEDKELLRDPDFSPDGKRMVFARGDFRDVKNEDLRIMDVASSHVSPIPGSNGFYGPSWSPDGQYIVALAFDESPLRLLNLRTQKWRTLSTNGVATFPTFSKDGRYIYFLRYGSNQGVFRIGVDGGNLEKIADLSDWHLTGFWGFSISLDPMDAPLVMRDVGTDDIYSLTLEAK